jgi:hypothetical protein
MVDTFRLKRSLYGGDLSSISIELQPFRLHYQRQKKQDTWPEAGLIAKQDWVRYPGPPICEVHGGLLNQQRLTAGYKAVMKSEDAPGQAISKGLLKADMWWNNLVPAHARLTHVRHFMSQHVVAGLQADGEPIIEEVGLRPTYAQYRLDVQDTLIVRARDGLFQALPHPFVIPAELVSPDTNAVELLRLCRGGEAIDLVDRLPFDELTAARYKQLTEEVLSGQTLNRWRQMARWMINRGDWTGYALANIVGSSLASNALALGANLVTSLSIGITTGLAANAAIGVYNGREHNTTHDCTLRLHQHDCLQASPGPDQPTSRLREHGKRVIIGPEQDNRSPAGPEVAGLEYDG